MTNMLLSTTGTDDETYDNDHHTNNNSHHNECANSTGGELAAGQSA